MDQCPECGDKVSSLAERCPNCGTDMNRRKWFGGGGLVIASLLLVVGALYISGYYLYPVVDDWVGVLVNETSRVEGASGEEGQQEEVNVTVLDAYTACQGFVEKRLASQVGTNVVTEPPYGETPQSVTERASPRVFRVSSRLSYSLANETEFSEVLYDCKIHYNPNGQWSVQRLNLRQR